MEVVNQQRWQKPPEGSWKINVDGAFWDREKKGAWGFVVRDDQGNAVLAGAGSLMSISDALIAETHACIAALQAAADHGLQNIVLESDSLILVRALQSDLYDRARGGMLFREAKYIMAMNFNTVIAVHTPRSCNVVAHTLAQFGGVRDQIVLLVGCILSLNL
jgi:ribonuclease HI